MLVCFICWRNSNDVLFREMLCHTQKLKEDYGEFRAMIWRIFQASRNRSVMRISVVTPYLMVSLVSRMPILSITPVHERSHFQARIRDG